MQLNQYFSESICFERRFVQSILKEKKKKEKLLRHYRSGMRGTPSPFKIFIRILLYYAIESIFFEEFGFEVDLFNQY